MAKAYGTVGIASGTGKLSANMSRRALLVQNLSGTYPIYANFGSEADDGSLTVRPNEDVKVTYRQYPDIVQQINLVTDYTQSTGTIVVTKTNTGSISASGTTLTIGSSAFVAGEVGQAITVVGAGVAGANLVTTIASYTSGTIVELTAAASTTVSGAVTTWNTGTQTTLTIGSSLFVAGDAGAEIEIVGAAAGGANLVTTIASYTSGTVVVLTAGATQNVSAARVRWGKNFPKFVVIDSV